MRKTLEILLGALVTTIARGHSEHSGPDERGDVPGWVMITVMTVGIVAALSGWVGPELTQMLRDAFNSVR